MRATVVPGALTVRPLLAARLVRRENGPLIAIAPFAARGGGKDAPGQLEETREVIMIAILGE